MNEDREDRVFDVLIEEAIGGAAPPDLAARILHRRSVSDPLPPPVQPRSQRIVTAAVASAAGATSNGSAAKGKGARRDTRRWPAGLVSVAIGVCIVVGGVAAGAAALSLFGTSRPQIAEQQVDTADGSPDESLVDGDKPAARDDGQSDSAPSPTDRGPTLADDGSKFNDRPPFAAPIDGDADSPPDDRPVRSVAALADDEVIAAMDEQLAASWSEHGVSPSSPASDSEWCRRTYIRLVGRIPTVDELTAFLDNAAADKRRRLLDELLAGEDFARNWASILTTVLIGRSGGMSNDSLAQREGLQQYLLEALSQNTPYDEMARELISAEGSNHQGDPDFNGATNFLLAGYRENATLATTRTARVFLGKQLQCAQCHHHPTNDWKQHEFWELNAFFRQMHVERRGKSLRLVNRDVTGKHGDVAEVETYFEDPTGRMKVAYPAFGEQGVPRTGLVEEFDRRRELADRIASSPDLSRAIVNRLWEHFFGYGFTMPIDDMGPHTVISHPALLDVVADQFAAHDHDLRRLVGWIASSRAFSLSSRVADDTLADTPERGSPALFSRYYARQLEPETVYNSLLVAAGDHDRKDFFTQEENRLAWLGQFTHNMETDEGNEQTAFDGAINQSLVLMNGPLTRRATSAKPGTVLHGVATARQLPEQKFEHLFLAAVARKPSPSELRMAASLVRANNGNIDESLSVFWWALLNSSEFLLDR